MAITRILLAVDGSKYSEAAVHLVKDMINSDVYVNILTVDETPYNIPITTEETPAILSESEISTESVEQGYKELFGDNSNVTTQYLVGHPGKTIVQVANSGIYDLVVVGHSGLNAVEQMVMGSVSSYVLNNVKCSVMVVKIF